MNRTAKQLLGADATATAGANIADTAYTRNMAATPKEETVKMSVATLPLLFAYTAEEHPRVVSRRR